MDHVTLGGPMSDFWTELIYVAFEYMVQHPSDFQRYIIILN